MHSKPTALAPLALDEAVVPQFPVDSTIGRPPMTAMIRVKAYAWSALLATVFAFALPLSGQTSASPRDEICGRTFSSRTPVVEVGASASAALASDHSVLWSPPVEALWICRAALRVGTAADQKTSPPDSASFSIRGPPVS
jgi:hypothetical protein